MDIIKLMLRGKIMLEMLYLHFFGQIRDFRNVKAKQDHPLVQANPKQYKLVSYIF